jgi:hypothetical protein
MIKQHKPLKFVTLWGFMRIKRNMDQVILIKGYFAYHTKRKVVR